MAEPLDSTTDDAALVGQHTPDAIRERIGAAREHSYLGDFVLGAVDGTVTTFAIVAGAAGAGLNHGIAAVLGLANVVADGFSMASSNFLKARADQQIVERFRREEERHIDEIPEGEREEIRQIFAAKGFDGTVLERIVAVITKDRRRWVDTMLTEEWGLRIDLPSPVRAACTTFVAFVLAGLAPLSPLFLAVELADGQMFLASAVLTALTFLGIGVTRGVVTQRPPLWEGIETVLIGGTAAALAYFVGVGLQDMVASG